MRGTVGGQVQVKGVMHDEWIKSGETGGILQGVLDLEELLLSRSLRGAERSRSKRLRFN